MLIDKELNWTISNIKKDINRNEMLLKINKICIKLLIPLFVLQYIICIKGLSCYFSNILMLVILVWIEIFLMIYIYYITIKELNLNIENLQKEEKELKYKLEDEMNFIAYLSAYRYLEASEKGIILDSNMRKSDILYVISKYKKRYEEKRVDYEKQHKKRIELNKN